MKKLRMAGYIRFSDPSTPLDANVMESQAKAIREYADREGYLYDISKHEYREAISAYTVPYMQRPTLLLVLDAAKRKEFDVLVVTEVRSISRRTVEVFVIYDLLQKHAVRFETIQEKFEDSATGHLILSARAFSAEVERENTYQRLQRGKRHRLEGGCVNGHPKSRYGYVFIDTQKEVKGAYALNTAIAYQDAELDWTEPDIILWMGERCLRGWSLAKIARTLTDMGVPVPSHKKMVKGKPVLNVWHASTVYDILTCEMYIGNVYANRYKRVENPKTKKFKMQERPREEWVLIEGIAPPIFALEMFENIQRQLKANAQDAFRKIRPDVPKDQYGLLRAGFAICGICGRRLHVLRRGGVFNGQQHKPQYSCVQRFGGDDLVTNHNTIITLHVLDKCVRQKIREVVLDPSEVRAKADERRKAPKPIIDIEDVQTTIENIQLEINNLFDLARHASNDSTRERLGLILEDLEQKKCEAEAMLIEMDDEDEHLLIEAEIVKFEAWAEKVRPYLGDPTYLDTASYEELRLAVRIIGLTAIVFPMHGEYPFRFRLESRPPEIMKYFCNQIEQSITMQNKALLFWEYK